MGNSISDISAVCGCSFRPPENEKDFAVFINRFNIIIIRVIIVRRFAILIMKNTINQLRFLC